MMIFFYLFAIVSKSLLIVWGTLPLPAMIGRGKYRFAGITKHPRKAWKTSGFPYFPPPLYAMMIYPPCCVISEPSSTAGSAGKTPAHPAFIYHVGESRLIVYIGFPFSAFLRIVPSSGLPLSRLMAGKPCPQSCLVECAI